VANLRKLQRLLPLRHKVIEPDTKIDLGKFVTFPDGYRPTNPSVVRFGQDLLVCVRGVAYVIDEKCAAHGNADQMPSLSCLFLISNELTFKGHVQLSQTRLDNVEDLKLFGGLGRIWGVGAVPVSDPRDPAACVATLVEFDAGLTDCRLIQFASPFGFPLEKNWAPFFANDAVHFVYSCQPLMLLRYDTITGSVAFAGPQRHDPTTLKFLEGGSSGGIHAAFGEIFLTHRRVVRLPSRKRIYLSRIRVLSKDLVNLAAGPFFSIGRPTVQFANGMLLDEDRVLITYGEMDATAQLACFSRERFERKVFPRL